MHSVSLLSGSDKTNSNTLIKKVKENKMLEPKLIQKIKKKLFTKFICKIH